MAIVMLSLVSNPYNPFTEFYEWSTFDRKEGFDTAGLLARIVNSSSEISESDQELAIEQAIDDIIRNPNFAGLYKKVVKDAA